MTAAVRFARAVFGMPDFGQGAGWTEASWRRAPRRAVPVHRLVSTNLGGYLNQKIVDRYVARAGGEPYVIEHEGVHYIADGHHRIAAAMVRGEETIVARVKQVGAR